MAPGDPASIEAVAVAAATLLATETIKGTAGEAGRRVLAAGERLVALARRRLGRAPAEVAVLDAVHADPKDTARVHALADLLRAHAVRDPEFLAALRDAVEAASAVRGSITATDAGIVASGDVHMQGEYVAGRDLRLDPSS